MLGRRVSGAGHAPRPGHAPCAALSADQDALRPQSTRDDASGRLGRRSRRRGLPGGEASFEFLCNFCAPIDSLFTGTALTPFPSPVRETAVLTGALFSTAVVLFKSRISFFFIRLSDAVP